MIKYLYSSSIILIVLFGFNGCSSLSPMLQASIDGDLKIVKAEIKAGKNINTLNNDGTVSALHYAAWNNHFNIVQYLVENNADVNIQSMNYSTPLLFAVSRDNLDIAKYLIDNGANTKGNSVDSLIHRAKSLKMLKLLLDTGIDINALDSANLTALHWAVINNSLERVKALIENGALTNIKHSAHGTVLDTARAYQQSL